MKKEKLILRKNIINLHSKGKKQLEISFLLDVPQSTVSYWIVRHRQTGKLEDLPRPGKSSKLSKLQIEELKEQLLDYAPERYGGESLGWTTKMAIKFVEEKYNVKYSMRRMQELFNKFGLSLITPRSEAYKGSKLARNSYRDEFKKNFNENIWIAQSLISTKQHSD